VWGRPRVLIGGAVAASLALAAGCGGGSRQDAGEKSASFQVEVVRASFPSKQAVARPATLELRVRNTGGRTIPNLAVSLDALTYRSTHPELSDPTRPVWAVEQGPGAHANPPVESQEVSVPGGGQTAYVKTWALGPLAAGRTQTFAWHVVPVIAGRHTVHFFVAAGLAGKARARLSGGGTVKGTLTANVAGAPPSTHVDPKTGKVVTGTFNGVP
jgi:hypothetical protein